MTQDISLARKANPILTRVRRGRLVWFLAAVLVALALIGALAYWMTRGETAVRYLTTPVTRGIVARTVAASGTVNPVLTIIVGSYVSGVIQELYCDYNTQVKKGQICAKIDPRPYQTIVDQNKADLATARAQLGKDKASLAYAKIAYDRDRVLLPRGIISQDTLDNAKSADDQAAAQIDVDQATILQREAALQAGQVNLEYTNIISPVDGTVVSRNITIGQTVAASFQTPTLFLIATDLTKMQVDTNVSEDDVGSIREVNKASFTVETFPNRSFAATVVQVRQAPQTLQNVVTYDVVLGVDNTALLLKPGMTATTRIVTDQRDNVLRVPDQALRFAPSGQAALPAHDQSAVWVLRDGTPHRVLLKLGLDDDTNSEVLEGELNAGDQVIIGEQRSDAGGTTGASRPRLFGF